VFPILAHIPYELIIIDGELPGIDKEFGRLVEDASGALDAALICTSLEIAHHQLGRLERLRLYATRLSDWQTITILDAVLNDMMEVKHRLTELMGRYVQLDSWRYF
jgi:ferritin-like metal-binding protein YciE